MVKVSELFRISDKPYHSIKEVLNNANTKSSCLSTLFYMHPDVFQRKMLSNALKGSQDNGLDSCLPFLPHSLPPQTKSETTIHTAYLIPLYVK